MTPDLTWRGPLRFLSLGWGVQSWTLAAMAALGEIEPIAAAIHADTTWEHQHTYGFAVKWTPWLEEHGVKVVTVKGENAEVVREDWSNSTLIPAFTYSLDGQPGQIRRQCTHDWKIMPIRRYIRILLSKGQTAVCIQGISFDEWRRIRESDVAYITHEYPLVDRKITRAGCIQWLQSHGLEVPSKSSCVFCPFKSRESWRTMKRLNGVDQATALAVDSTIRDKRPGFKLYVHPGRKPLAEAVDIPEDHGAKQLTFEEEQPCDSGYCFT